ncbi:MAG: hypothetical protein M5T61_10445 [Acidimicrobiia bacterium]|nr:hypothetical protein [Acidimicrobiia bacterium]
MTSAAKAVAQAIANALKTASPTKMGPMSDLDHWLDGFAPAYLRGLDDDRIRKALANATVIGRDMPASMYAPAAGVGVPNAGGIPAAGCTYYVTVNVAGSVTTEGDLVRKVRDGLISKGQGLTEDALMATWRQTFPGMPLKSLEWSPSTTADDATPVWESLSDRILEIHVRSYRQTELDQFETAGTDRRPGQRGPGARSRWGMAVRTCPGCGSGIRCRTRTVWCTTGSAGSSGRSSRRGLTRRRRR